MKNPNSSLGAAALAIITAILLLQSPANAASITWGAPTSISGGGDVSLTGTLFDAANNGGTGVPSTTVSGVTFAPFVTNGSGLAFADTSGKMTLSVSTGSINGGSNFGNINPPFSNLSPASYQTLLSSASASFNTLSMTLTINTLTIGNTYQVELWANFSDLAVGASETVSAGNSTTLQYNATNQAGGVGQFVIGTFTADAASEAIRLTENFNPAYASALLNAVEVRTIAAVPEPSIPGLMISGAACLLAVRRFCSRIR